MALSLVYGNRKSKLKREDFAMEQLFVTRPFKAGDRVKVCFHNEQIEAIIRKVPSNPGDDWVIQSELGNGSKQIELVNGYCRMAMIKPGDLESYLMASFLSTPQSVLTIYDDELEEVFNSNLVQLRQICSRLDLDLTANKYHGPRGEGIDYSIKRERRTRSHFDIF